MAWIKGDDETEQKYFDYLEDLRQSGDTNMFGAGRYLQQAFGLDRDAATDVLARWMKYHDDPKRRLKGPATETKTTVEYREVATVNTRKRK